MIPPQFDPAAYEARLAMMTLDERDTHLYEQEHLFSRGSRDAKERLQAHARWIQGREAEADARAIGGPREVPAAPGYSTPRGVHEARLRHGEATAAEYLTDARKAELHQIAGLPPLPPPGPATIAGGDDGFPGLTPARKAELDRLARDN